MEVKIISAHLCKEVNPMELRPESTFEGMPNAYRKHVNIFNDIEKEMRTFKIGKCCKNCSCYANNLFPCEQPGSIFNATINSDGTVNLID
jgi:hypothetical protein